MLLKFLSLAGVFLPMLVFATHRLPHTIPTGPTSLDQLLGVLNKIINILFTILMIAAVIFILIAAFNYLTAMGSADKVKTANNMIIYAAIAIAVALVAKGIPWVISSIIGGGVSTPAPAPDIPCVPRGGRPCQI